MGRKRTNTCKHTHKHTHTQLGVGNQNIEDPAAIDGPRVASHPRSLIFSRPNGVVGSATKKRPCQDGAALGGPSSRACPFAQVGKSTRPLTRWQLTSSELGPCYRAPPSWRNTAHPRNPTMPPHLWPSGGPPTPEAEQPHEGPRGRPPFNTSTSCNPSSSAKREHADVRPGDEHT